MKTTLPRQEEGGGLIALSTLAHRDMSRCRESRNQLGLWMGHKFAGFLHVDIVVCRNFINFHTFLHQLFVLFHYRIWFISKTC